MAKSLAIIGFGNQAKAWALNLRDSGFKIFIGLRKGSSNFDSVKKLNFDSFEIGENLPCENVAFLTPDNTHFEVASKIGNKEINAIFAHGFSLTENKIQNEFPNFNCLLLAPKAIASEVRLAYETGGKLGGLYSVELSKNKEVSEKLLRDIAHSLGLSSLHQTTIETETKADLFSEQTLLCSTLPYSALYAFNKLVEKGINEETAYFECWYEVKLIADTMVRLGPKKFFELISPNALAGSELGRQALFDSEYFNKLESIYNNIESRNFNKELDATDFESLKKEVVTFWSHQKLTKAHERLSKELF